MYKYSLLGVNGNAFSIMGFVTAAMRETGYTDEEQEAYYEEATADDYDHLLRVSVKKIDEINAKLPSPKGDDE